MATLALRPNAAGLPTGSVIGGSATTGYTLTLPVGTATFSYDVIVTFDNAAYNVSRIQGAIVTTSAASITGTHLTSTVNLADTDTPTGTVFTNTANGTPGVFSLTSQSTTGQGFGTKYEFKPGVLASASSAGGTGNAALKGVGPQGTTYSSLVNSPSVASGTRFDVTYATVVAGTTVDALTASVSITGTAAGDTASLLVADGTGSTGTSAGAGTVYQSVLAWNEGSNSYFSGVSGAYQQFGLTVTFANVVSNFPGDANGDGFVNLADFTIVANHFGQSTANGFADGDFNGDGVVNLTDFTILSNNFGHTPGRAAPTVVPEPSSIGMLGLGILPLLRRRAR